MLLPTNYIIALKEYNKISKYKDWDIELEKI